MKRVLFKATSRFLTPYVKLTKLTGKSWVLEISVVEQLLQFRFPFRLPRSFLGAKNKNELRVKLLLIQSLAVSDLQKTFDVQEFCYQISTSNTQPALVVENSGDANVYGLSIDFSDSSPDNNTSYFLNCQDTNFHLF